MRNEPGCSLVEFTLGEQVSKPGQVGDEFDGGVQLSHLTQQLETYGVWQGLGIASWLRLPRFRPARLWRESGLRCS
jgi:hypothetical protein